MRDLSFVGRNKCWRRWWKRHSKGKYMFKPLISDVKRLCRRVVALPISVFQANIDWLFGVHIDRWTYISHSVFSSFRRSCRLTRDFRSLRNILRRNWQLFLWNLHRGKLVDRLTEKSWSMAFLNFDSAHRIQTFHSPQVMPVLVVLPGW